MNKLFKETSWGVLVIPLFSLLLFSCSEPDPEYSKEGGALLWVDERHEDHAIKSAVQRNLENSSIIVAQISWGPSDSSFFRNTAWYFSLAKEHGKSFMINIDWQKEDRSGTKNNWSFSDTAIANLFKSDMHRLVNSYNPDYINLGVEVNYYALTSSKGFKSFITVFRDLKQELKELNPKLEVGLSYQLELLYGHHEDWEESETLAALNVIYEDLDFLGISTYPNMVTPKNREKQFFSLNYLDSLTKEYSLAIGVSETAVSDKLFDDKQRGIYVDQIFDKANNLDLKFIIWGSTIDDPRNEAWNNKIGLLDVNGKPKKEFELWRRKNTDLFR